MGKSVSRRFPDLIFLECRGPHLRGPLTYSVEALILAFIINSKRLTTTRVCGGRMIGWLLFDIRTLGMSI